MKKKLRIILLMLLLALTVCFAIVQQPDFDHPENEIRLQIQLNLKEDIGLLTADYEFGEAVTGRGGVSNADKTMLKHDDLLYYNLENQNEEAAIPNTATAKIRFAVVTEYVDPNYDNDYPQELTRTLDEISFPAKLGRSYAITISGDQANGYTAAFHGEIYR